MQLQKPIVASWSTSSGDPRAAVNRWRDVVGQCLMELEIRAPTESFHARIGQTTMGPTVLSKLDAASQTVDRTPRCISGGRKERYFDVVQLRSGRIGYRHRGYEETLEMGDCVALDRASPYSFSSTPTSSVLFSVPYDWLCTWAADADALAGRRLRSDVGWGRAFSAALAQLDVQTVESLVLSPEVVADQLGALLVLAGEPNRSEKCTASNPLLLRAREVLNDLANDPMVDPAAVAARLGISKRYLHLLFAKTGRTFGRELTEIRLLRARRILSGPGFRNTSIGEISFRCGYNDPSHFARLFRQRFGFTPNRARTRVHSDP